MSLFFFVLVSVSAEVQCMRKEDSHDRLGCHFGFCFRSLQGSGDARELLVRELPVMPLTGF